MPESCLARCRPAAALLIGSASGNQATRPVPGRLPACVQKTTNRQESQAAVGFFVVFTGSEQLRRLSVFRSSALPFAKWEGSAGLWHRVALAGVYPANAFVLFSPHFRMHEAANKPAKSRLQERYFFVNWTFEITFRGASAGAFCNLISGGETGWQGCHPQGQEKV